MEYISIREISKKWNMKERKVTQLCRENRIAGVRKKGNTWLVPNDSIKPIDKRTKEYENKISTYKEDNKFASYIVSGGDKKIIEEYKKIYKKDPMYTTFTPYRISPIGAHIDHNLGKRLGFAIDKGIHIAYSIKLNGIVEIRSLQFNKRGQWHVRDVPLEKRNDWADNLRGATLEISKKYPIRYGISAVIDGELPIIGSSSSSAMLISFINSLAFVNNIKLTKEELIEIAYKSETKYVGIHSGKFDHTCEIYAKKNNLLFMDMMDNKKELIETPKNMDKYKILIIFSGIEKNIEKDIYNKRVDELRCAAYTLKAYSNVDYSKFEETNMREIKEDIFIKYKNKLPKQYQKRAIHFYEEMKRVEKGIEHYKKGNLKEFGKLITQSGESTINLWETGSNELINLFNIIKNIKNVYGTRFAGSGFKGCCFAIINPDYEKEIIKEIESKYISIYPNLKNKFSCHSCTTSNGINL